MMQGYAPIRQDYEDFYTRRMYYRIHVNLFPPATCVWCIHSRCYGSTQDGQRNPYAPMLHHQLNPYASMLLILCRQTDRQHVVFHLYLLSLPDTQISLCLLTYVGAVAGLLE